MSRQHSTAHHAHTDTHSLSSYMTQSLMMIWFSQEGMSAHIERRHIEQEYFPFSRLPSLPSFLPSHCFLLLPFFSLKRNMLTWYRYFSTHTCLPVMPSFLSFTTSSCSSSAFSSLFLHAFCRHFPHFPSYTFLSFSSSFSSLFIFLSYTYISVAIFSFFFWRLMVDAPSFFRPPLHAWEFS